MILYQKIILTFLLIASVSVAEQSGCTAKNSAGADVLKITYSATGGRGGNYENLEISPDSLFYIGARRGVEKTVKEKTTTAFWQTLTRKFQSMDFEKIKSNPGHSLYDGIDVTITVETQKEKYSIVNGNEDTLNYKKISLFTDLLEKKLGDLRAKIAW